MKRNRVLELIDLTNEIGPSRAAKIVRFWSNWKTIKDKKERDFTNRTWQEIVGCEDGYSFNTNYEFLRCTANTLRDYFVDKKELPERTVNEIEFILNYNQTKLKI